jgi:predicted nucleic acid-binding protein
MAYNIRSIDMAGLAKKKYFFDANLWLKILKPQLVLSPKDKKYIDFFEKFKTSQNHPRIAVTTLVLAEVINRYLRDVTYPLFCKKQGQINPDKSYYKEVYRSSAQFTSDYISLCEDIKAYQNFYDLVADGLGTEIKQKDILTSPPQSLDFNDNYYYKMALKHGFTIITDDKDFFVENVEILTFNNQLIEKAKAIIVIKKDN